MPRACSRPDIFSCWRRAAPPPVLARSLAVSRALLHHNWRDLTVRYRQTVIGVAWAVVRPILTMLIFSFIFGRVAKLHSDGATPYPILVFAGLMPWTLFSSILSDASREPGG